MPKTTIEFSADEEHDLEMCLNGHKYYAVLHDIYNYLRTHTKYASDETPEEVLQALYETKDFLIERMSEYNIDI